MKLFIPALAIFMLLALPAVTQAQPDPSGLYMPQRTAAAVVHSQDITLDMAGREKPLSLRIRWPSTAEGTSLPVIIWSHGAFGSKDGYEPLCSFWAENGYIVIQPTHADSTQEGTLPLLKNPASFKNWDERPKEISFIIDNLEVIKEKIPALAGYLDEKSIGIGGHSFGANTAMLVAGMTTKGPFGFSRKRKSFSDTRPKAFVMLSPQGTGRLTDAESFATIARPSLFATGSKDDSGRDGQPFSWRLEPYNYAAAGNKYLLFIDGAYHGFGGISGKTRGPNSGPDNPAQVKIVQAATLAFWDAWLKKDPEALIWLQDGALADFTQDAARIDQR